MSNGQTVFFFKDTSLVGKALTKPCYSLCCHKLEQLMKAAWHIKNITQLFLNFLRAFPPRLLY